MINESLRILQLPFKRIGQEAKIPAQNLLRPDIVLQDYNQRPIPVGAKVELPFCWKGRVVTTPVYIWSDIAARGPCLLGTNVVGPLELVKLDIGVHKERASKDAVTEEATIGNESHSHKACYGSPSCGVGPAATSRDQAKDRRHCAGNR